MGLSPLITVTALPRCSHHSRTCVDFPVPLGAQNRCARPWNATAAPWTSIRSHEGSHSAILRYTAKVSK